MKSIKTKDKVWVQWRGKIYGLSTETNKRRSSSSGETKELVAPFSCKVLKIHVKAGQTVAKGDPVVVVEAMKMEYSYTSPKEGVIDSISVKEGEIVSGGTQFVRWRNS
jgi:pyruvate carboxylase